MNSETSNEVKYSRLDATDEWYPPGGDTTNPIKSVKAEVLKNRKERLAERSKYRRLAKELSRIERTRK